MSETFEVIQYGHSDPALGESAQIVNRFHYRRVVSGGLISKILFDTAWHGTVDAAWQGLLSVGYKNDYNTVRLMEDGTDPPTVFAGCGDGAVAGDMLPTINCATLLYRTVLKGRSYKGGKHLGPISEASTTGQALTAGGHTLLNNLATVLAQTITDGNGNNWAPFVFSPTKSTGLTTPTPTIFATQVSQIVVNDILHQLKSRAIRNP